MIPPDIKEIPYEEFERRRHELEKPVFFKDLEEGEDEDRRPVGLAVFCNFDKLKITSDFMEKFVRSFISEEKQEMRGAYENIKNFFIIAPTSARTGQIDVDKNALTMTNLHDELKIEYFRDEDLMFNVLKHDLVPEHILLSERQKEELLKN